MLDLAQHLAAGLGDDVGDVALQRVAEGIVGGEEEPALAAGLDDRRAGAVGQREGVVDPVHGVGVAELAGDVGRGRIGARGRSSSCRRRRATVAIDEDEAPVPRITSTCSVSNQRPAMVAATSALFCTSAWTISIFLPTDRAAEIVDRHLHGDDGAGAVDVGIEARHVGEHAQLHHVVGQLLGRRGRRPCRDGQAAAPQNTTLHQFPSQGFLVVRSLARCWHGRKEEEDAGHDRADSGYPDQGRRDGDLHLPSGTRRAVSAGAVPDGCARHPRGALRHGPPAGDGRATT